MEHIGVKKFHIKTHAIPMYYIMADGTGRRYNHGKTRHELPPAFAQEQYAKVLTMGAEKYGDNNWRGGMSWMSVIASAERHLQAIKTGQDYDAESGLLHSAHVMCNMAFLTEYYKIYPNGDDRPHKYMAAKKIGLKVDGILFDFIGNYNKYLDSDVANDREFWEGIPAQITAGDLPFEPHLYVISPGIPRAWVKRWLLNNGFPERPICTDPSGTEADIFIDDDFENFVKLNRAGCSYLFDADHNKKYDVGHKRLRRLKDLV